MNANEQHGTRIDLSDVVVIRFDMLPGFAWVRVPGKTYRLTMSELLTLVANRTVFV